MPISKARAWKERDLEKGKRKVQRQNIPLLFIHIMKDPNPQHLMIARLNLSDGRSNGHGRKCFDNLDEVVQESKHPINTPQEPTKSIIIPSST